ncbi:S-layer homology domain-containing protein, partial [Paenibacillus sepulcri]|nr:S-layer homology domain-containing protein [Paenibacillus sepulcri]
FGDSAQISDWARQAVATVVLSGLAEGADGMFRPLIDLKRAEAANLVQQLLQQSVLIDRR